MAAVQKARKVQKKVVKGVHGTRVKKVFFIKEEIKMGTKFFLLNRSEPA